ncbi:GSCFA domain-containing protein [Myroides sp. LJL119]
MRFTTPVPIQGINKPITYNDKILAIGSCFAVNISGKLREYQFQVTTNPFGILFHPLAIQKMLEMAVEGKEFTEKDVFCHNEVWSCFFTHSDLNQLEASALVDVLNEKTQTLKKSLKQSSYCIITLGTAWVYKFIESGQVVANCHKVPNKLFEKQLLSYSDIFTSLQKIIKLVRYYNKDLQVIFTLSPVRHIKDGIVENQRSKSLLHGCIQDLLEQENCKLNCYFPAYEIMMDELRDYRFFKSDLIHPNQMAIDFIWQKFIQGCISENMLSTMSKVEQVQKGLRHVPFNPMAKAHLDFLDSLIQKIDDLLDQYPFMNFR